MEEEKTALTADWRRDGRGHNTNDATGPSKPCPDWPGGKTVSRYEFHRNDLHVSAHPPNRECYICTSPKQVPRYCSHYSTWSHLRRAMLIHVDLDPEEEEKEHLGYIAMIVEFRIESSCGCLKTLRSMRSWKHLASNLQLLKDLLRPETVSHKCRLKMRQKT